MQKENLSKKKSRMKEILSILSNKYPDVKIQLDFSNCFELLVATILSAQCTDERVNIVTKTLFKKYLTPNDYANAITEELESLIFSTGFYRAKAKNIIATAKAVIANYNGNVPNSMDELLTLPGVGRKTANVILGHCFDIPGIVVDTHVIRISNRLGLVDTTDPVKIEFELMKIIPKNIWVTFTHYFINHGRHICKAKKYDCLSCKISKLCPSSKVVF